MALIYSYSFVINVNYHDITFFLVMHIRIKISGDAKWENNIRIIITKQNEQNQIMYTDKLK